MKDHYQITDAEFVSLQKIGVSVADMFRAVDEFHAAQAPVTKVSLMYYIDAWGGDWIEGVYKRKADRIARAVFNCLPVVEKIEVAEYAACE